MFKILFLTSLLIFSSALYANIDQGKELFDENNCINCHDLKQFKYRKNKVHNFNKLHKVVNACAINSGIGLFDDEVKDVSLYLNHNYYHFKIKE